MKLRILRKWDKRAYSYAKNGCRTKYGRYRGVGELTPKQTWLLYYKHRDDYSTFLLKIARKEKW